MITTAHAPPSESICGRWSRQSAGGWQVRQPKSPRFTLPLPRQHCNLGCSTPSPATGKTKSLPSRQRSGMLHSSQNIRNPGRNAHAVNASENGAVRRRHQILQAAPSDPPSIALRKSTKIRTQEAVQRRLPGTVGSVPYPATPVHPQSTDQEENPAGQ